MAITHHTMQQAFEQFDPTTCISVAGPLHYRWIATNYGGTYSHSTDPPPDLEEPPNLLNLPAIGTWQCRTCVGVYMQISPTTCFVAHINAAHIRPRWHRSQAAINPYTNRLVTEAEGAYVQEEVMRRLNEESYRSAWPHVDAIQRVCLVFPMLRFGAKTLSGAYIARGVCDFLRRPGLYVDTESEGFVVKFSDGSITRFPLQRPELAEPLLPDDDFHYVGHRFHGGETPRWFINIGSLRQQRRFLGVCEDVLTEGMEGVKWARRRRRWSV